MHCAVILQGSDEGRQGNDNSGRALEDEHYGQDKYHQK